MADLSAEPLPSAPTKSMIPRSGLWPFTVVDVVFFAVFTLVLVLVVAGMVTDQAALAGNAVALLLAVAALAVMPFFRRVCAFVATRLESRTRRFRVVVAALSTVGFILIQSALAHATARPLGFDAGGVFRAASHLARTGEPLAEMDSYFSLYPNNIALTFIFEKWLSVFSFLGEEPADHLRTLIGLNVAVLTASAVLTFGAAKRVSGTAGALAITPAIVLFIGVCPWLHVPYSDTVAMVFVAASFALAVIDDAERPLSIRIAIWAAIGAVAGLGIAVKPTVLFVWIAVAVVALILAAGDARAGAGRLRRTVRSSVPIVVSAVVLGGIVVATPVLLNSTRTVGFDMSTNRNAMPITHFLAMGATGWGAYDPDDVQQMLQTPPDERSGVSLEKFFSRVAEKGPVGYPSFLAVKTQKTFGDGTFFQWGEGGLQAEPYLSTDAFSRAVQDLYDADGGSHTILVVGWQAGWLVVLALSVAPMVIGRPSGRHAALTAARLALLMLFAFLLLFETRSRYLLLYLPIFLVLAAASITAFGTRRHGRRRSESRVSGP